MRNWTNCWPDNKDYAPKGAFPFIFRQINIFYYGTYMVTKLYSEVITIGYIRNSDGCSWYNANNQRFERRLVMSLFVFAKKTRCIMRNSKIETPLSRNDHVCSEILSTLFLFILSKSKG